MGVAEILVLINGLLSLAFNLYKFLSQIKGDQPVPTWEELLMQNAALQVQIDEEKEKTL